MGEGAAIGYIVGAIIGAGASAASSRQQRKSAKRSADRDREAQERAAEEQRLLDAQAQRLAAQTEEEEEESVFELGTDPLSVGRTKRGVRKVQAAQGRRDAPKTTGLKVG